MFAKDKMVKNRDGISTTIIIHHFTFMQSDCIAWWKNGGTNYKEI